jgi:hypothetical protein
MNTPFFIDPQLGLACPFEGEYRLLLGAQRALGLEL